MHLAPLRWILSMIAGLVTLISVQTPTLAAENDEQRDAGIAAPSAPRRDFYFAPPIGTIGLRGTWVFARAGSDLFDFVEDQLTVEKHDFSGPAVAMDLGIALKPRLDVVVGLQINRSSARSEYRDFVDDNRLPIEQTTRLKAVDLSGSIRYALLPRGYEVSRLAWVPRRVVPYVGAGVGAMWYEFEQSGDFVDFVDLQVFNDNFRSAGWAPSAHGFGGLDVRFHRRLFLTVEGRYVWANATLGDDFVDFDPIDLAGFRIATGVNFVF
jgi:hypothetical protein